MRRRVASACLGTLLGLAVGAGPTPRVDVRAADGDDPVLTVLRALAAEAGQTVIVSDTGVVTVQDPVGDAGAPGGFDDLTAASIATLPEVPSWLLAAFDCGADNVACSEAGGPDSAFGSGAIVVSQRLARPPAGIPPSQRGEWGPILALDQYPTAPLVADNPFSGASHVVITRVEGDRREVLSFTFIEGEFKPFPTNARSMWIDDDLVTLIPIDQELQTPPIGWDVYGSASDGATTGRDTVRSLDGAPLLGLPGQLPDVAFAAVTASASASAAASGSASPGASGSAPVPSTSLSPSPSPFPSPSPSPVVTPTASPVTSPSPAPTAAQPTDPVATLGGLWDNLLFRLLIGLLLALLGLALLRRRLVRRGDGT